MNRDAYIKFIRFCTPSVFPKVKLSKKFTFIKNIINIYNLFFNNYSLIKFNQFKYL